MILSKEQIETIAMDFIRGFRKTTGIYEIFTPIDQVASDYLNLEVIIAKLSDDGTVCGLTAYDDTYVKINVDGIEQIVTIKQNQVVLDSSFVEPNQVRALCGKRRFTLAHEIAHQILFAMETEEDKANYRKFYSTRVAHTVRELKTHEDWNEWQANMLGACILMPKDSIEIFMEAIKLKSRLVAYAGKLYNMDKNVLDVFCCTFGVSRTAGMIRLKELGYLIEHTEVQYG